MPRGYRAKRLRRQLAAKLFQTRRAAFRREQLERMEKFETESKWSE